jgi:hypothetical protein
MTITIAVLNIGFLAFISYQVWRKEEPLLQQFFWPALLVKLTAGICLGLIYTYYYTVGDTFNYFEDGAKLANLARTDAGSYVKFLAWGDDLSAVSSELLYKQPRAMFLSKITSLFCLLTADSYWIISIYFSAITFFCSWILVKKIIALHKPFTWAAVISFLFFPSVVFWSSGIIKESIAMASLFFLSFIFIKVWRKEAVTIVEWPLTLLSVWMLWNLKYYYLAIFLPVTFTTLVTKFILSRFSVKNTALKIALWAFIFTIPLFLVSRLHPNFYPERFMEVVVFSYNEFKSISAPEDVIHYTSLEPTPLSMVKNMPLALFSGIFRPFISEAKSTLQFFIAVENLILLVLTGMAFTRIKKFVNHQYRILLFSILVYTFLLCVFLALSTPNFGTLSRYRVGFLPFLVFVLTIENPLINKLMTLKISGDLVR